MKDMLLTLKKIANSVLALLIVVSNFSFVPSVQAVGEPTLTIGSQSASNGATLNVPINASNFTDVGGIDVKVQFDDTKLTYINTTLNNLPAGAFINLVENQITITWDDFSNPLNIIDGILVTLNFTVITSTTSDTNLTFVGTREINDSSGNQMGASFAGGVISLNPDTTAPVITLLGDAIVNLLIGDAYADAGATASDNIDGDITANIIRVNSVNTAVIGTYTVTYNVSDTAGNAASQVSRTVIVSGGMLVISLTGAPEITLTVGDTYTELGATASDQIDGPLAVQITGAVDTTVIGDYTITYTATDADNNTVTVSRIIHVVAATVPVTIPMIGGGAISQVTDHSYDIAWNWTGASDVHFSLKQSTGGAELSEVTQIGAVVGQTDYTYTFDQLAPNTGYLFSVETVDNVGGNSGFGNTNPIITLASVPSNVQAVADSPTQITVSWNGDGTSYRVTNLVDRTTQITNLTSQQFTDLTCNNVEYTFSIGAINSEGVTNPTEALASAFTQACPPPVGGGGGSGGGDTSVPVITLLGNATINLTVGDTYTDAGATAADNVDGDITANIVTMGLPINTATPGAYTITYNVLDAAGNPAKEVSRTVNIVFGRVPHRKGTVNAAISLDVYTDYQCPFCVRFQPTLNQALEEYQGEVNYYINHFPLSVIDPNAWKAAEATECANDQGDVYFWRMHDWLVSMATDFTVDDIRNFAATLIDFDAQQFNSCLDSGSKQQVIQEHINSGGDILGVPTTYVRRNSDGQSEKVEGAVSYEDLKQVIDSLLSQPVPELPEPGQPVPDTIPPVVALSGDATINLTVGDTYTDAGATAADNVDGDITANIVTVNPVNTAIAGTYTVTYNVSDVAGNAAVAITRTVIVSEVVVPPVVVEPPPAPVAPPRGGGGGSAIVILSSPSSVGSTASQTFPVAALAPIVPTVIARTVTPQVLGVRVFSEDVLLRVDGRSIYSVRGRTLHSIPNAEVLRRFAAHPRLEVTAEDIVGYEIGRAIPVAQPAYAATTLLRVNSRDIYAVTGRTLHRVPNPRALWPYRDFTRLEVGDDALIEFAVGAAVPVL